MTRPYIVPGSIATVSINNSGGPTFIKPANLKRNDLILTLLHSQSSSDAVDYACPGFTRWGFPFAPATAATRVNGFFVYPVGNPLDVPDNFTFTRPAVGARQVGGICIIRSALNDNTGGHNTTQSTSVGPVVIDAANVAVNESLLVEFASAVFSSPTVSTNPVVSNPPTTQMFYIQNPTSGDSEVSRDVMLALYRSVEAGSSNLNQVTWDGVPVNGTGLQLAFKPAPAVISTISTWRTEGNFGACAHRGCPDGLTRAEMVENTYDYAVDVLGFDALEASCWRSSDGVFVLSHDQTTGRIFNLDLDIPTTDWATLSTLTSDVGGYPMMRLDAFLTKYAPSKVLFVEYKNYADGASLPFFLDLLELHDPLKEHIVFKSAGTATTTFVIAKDNYQFTTWGYFFGDVGSEGAQNLPTEWVPQMDWVGLSSGPSNLPTDQEWWDWCRSRNIDIMGHVVRSQADWDAMRLQGASMGMVNVSGLIPLDGDPLPPFGGDAGLDDDDLYWFFDIL